MYTLGNVVIPNIGGVYTLGNVVIPNIGGCVHLGLGNVVISNIGGVYTLGNILLCTKFTFYPSQCGSVYNYWC